MPLKYALALLAAGVGIIAVLAFVAARLLRQLQQQRRRQLNDAAQTAERRQHNKQFARDSIAILARTALSGQVGLTEASIRITALLDFIGSDDTERQRCDVLYRLTRETSHIPRLEDWRHLNPTERRDFEAQMADLEAHHSDAIAAALRSLSERFPLPR